VNWIGLFIDVAIIAGLGRAFMRGSQVGLLRVVFDVLGLVVAVVAGFWAFQKLNPWLSQHLHVPALSAPLVIFSLVWIVAELTYIVLLRFSPLLKPHHQRLVSLSGLLASVISATNYLVVVGLGIVLLVGLPLPGQVKTALADSRISSAVLSSTNQLQSRVNQFVDKNIVSTLNFLTVSTKIDNQSIALGFAVSNGQVRPDLEDKMLTLVNNERTSRGIAPLVMNDKARAVARAHSQDMLARGYFSHVTPEGVDPFERMRDGGVIFLSAGENLALAPTLSLAHNGLMNSPEHRANILDSSYRTVGIGIIDAGKYGLMITQDFTN